MTGTTDRASPITSSPVLAWFFVSVWGSGYIASKIGLQYAPPFTFLAVRFAFGIVVLLPLLALWQRQDPLRWPRGGRAWMHVVVAGLLMHAANLGASHYSQYLGMSAGVTALVLAAQPLVTALIAVRLLRERLRLAQWLGVFVGLLGVALVVWHKIDIREVSWGASAAVLIALASITAATLYQRIFSPSIDLRAACGVQFAASVAVLTPLAFAVEGFEIRFTWPLFGAIAFLVICASIFAVNAFHTLMRRGEATRVTSLLYLTPIFAVALEWLLFGVVPTALTVFGIAVTCAGVALVALRVSARTAAV